MTSHFSLAAIFMIKLPVLYPIQVGNKPEPLTQWYFAYTLYSQYNTTEVFMVSEVSQCKSYSRQVSSVSNPKSGLRGSNSFVVIIRAYHNTSKLAAEADETQRDTHTV